jgi:glycosyltransferase involved in cell wall biosynthesis
MVFNWCIVIRVGFIINFRDMNWMGGVNYYKNLINAINSLPNRKIEPVILTGYTSDSEILNEINCYQIIKTRMLDTRNPFSIIRNIVKNSFHRDILFEYLLNRHNISVFSHFLFVGEKQIPPHTIPTIGWIPDFQHKYLPNFFSAKEITERDKAFHSICEESTLVIFSSMTVKKDAENFYPEYAKKYRVLHFVPSHFDFEGLPDMNQIIEKYRIPPSYFIVPNQFWIHKNHMVILEALKILKIQGHSITVIATGNTSDSRQPDYFSSIQEKIKEYNLTENFIVLGIIPYKALLQLMIHSMGVINPSRFEGWSSSVEEAKALDKRIILSDIPIHREQNPKNGLFFPHDNPQKLATLLLSSSSEFEQEKSMEKTGNHSQDHEMQIKKFSQNYENIVLEALELYGES